MALYIGFAGVKQQLLQACLYNWIRGPNRLPNAGFLRPLEIYGVLFKWPGITIFGALKKQSCFLLLLLGISQMS